MDEIREMGRRIAALRERVEHVCPVCGERFVGVKQARYCSAKCRQKALRDRRRPPAPAPGDDAQRRHDEGGA